MYFLYIYSINYPIIWSSFNIKIGIKLQKWPITRSKSFPLTELHFNKGSKLVTEIDNTEIIMPNGQRVYVGNLASDCRERDIEKFFKGYGKFGEVSMKQGYGFVDFEDYRDADDAVHDLNGKDMLGER